MRFIKKRLPKILFICLIASLFWYEINSEAARISTMNQRRDEIKQEIDTLKIELGRLQDYYELSKTDEFSERIAREKLGMVRTNEIIYYIHSDDSTSVSVTTSDSKDDDKETETTLGSDSIE